VNLAIDAIDGRCVDPSKAIKKGAGRIRSVAVAFTDPTVNIVSAMSAGQSHDRDATPREVK
jgi:hypothetical protein